MNYAMAARLGLAGSLLSVAAMASSADAPAASAKAAVDAIYRDLPRTDFDYRRVRYAPELRRLLARERAKANDEVGLIDAVPFCDCQDTAEDYAFTATSRATAPGKAEVTVRLRNALSSIYRIDTVRLASGWAVADIHGPEHASFAGWLRRNLSLRPLHGPRR